MRLCKILQTGSKPSFLHPHQKADRDAEILKLFAGTKVSKPSRVPEEMRRRKRRKSKGEEVGGRVIHKTFHPTNHICTIPQNEVRVFYSEKYAGFSK